MIAIATKIDVNCIDSMSRWEAKLHLGLTRKNRKTILSKRRHIGPLTIQRPFYPEKKDTCHLYILHPPGGVVGGDTLNIDIECGPATSTLITTPAANKFYRSMGPAAWLSQMLTVKNSAVLEWLPQETILFNGCRVCSKTIINLQQDAKFFGWEIVSFGRPASGELFTRGTFRQSFEIWKNDKPLLIDRVNIRDRAEVFNSSWGLKGKPVMGLLAVITNNAHHMEKARDQIHAMIEGVCNISVTLINQVLICRCLGTNATSMFETFTQIWKRIRFILLNKPYCPPRIWAT